MIDFGKSLIKASKSNFEKTKIDDCYFHLIKLLRNKAKLYG